MAAVQLQARSTVAPLRSHGGRRRNPSLRLRPPYLPRIKGLSLADNKVTAILAKKMSSLGPVAIDVQRPRTMPNTINGGGEEKTVEKINMIADASADRAEMHRIIGQQRDNWNALLLSSVNTLNLTAAIMVTIGATTSPHFHALRISSAVLFAAGAAMMAATNRLQPSQLAEEQRNATRLFSKLERSIRTSLSLRPPKTSDVDDAMERVLALDKAYPLPLLPQMLDRFPETLTPTRWWPRIKNKVNYTKEESRWSKEKEEAMRGVLKVLKLKDEEQYVRIGKMVRDINFGMAVSGPVLAAVAALGSSFLNAPGLGQWPAAVGVVAGVMASIVHSLEHGGQVGMVFELFRNLAGYYKLVQEEIESNLDEEEEGRREDWELFELRMALQLGRPASEFPSFAKYASLPGYVDKDEIPEFASKLF